MARTGMEMERYVPGEKALEQYVLVEAKRPPLGKREYLTIFFRYFYRMAAIFLGTVLTVIVAVLLIPPTFEAKSTLMVKLGREYLNQTGLADRGTMLSLAQEKLLSSEIQILTSPGLLEKTLSAMTVKAVYPDLAESPSGMTALQAAVLKAREKLSVSEVLKSNVLSVTFEHEDPKVAARFVNTLVDFYKEKHLEVFSDPRSTFFVSKLSDFEKKLKSAETQMEGYKQKNQVFAPEEQRTLLFRQRFELETSLMNARNQIEELDRKIAYLGRQKETRSKDGSSYTITERDSIITNAQTKLLDLQLREQNLLKQYNEGSRLVRDVREEIKLVHAFLKKQEAEISSKTRTGNPVYMEVEKELIRTRSERGAQAARAAALKEQLAGVEKQIQSFDGLEKEFMTLKRDKEYSETFYRVYQERLEEARISDEMNRQKMANISVIQPAVPPVEKSKPQRTLIVLMGAFLAAVASLGYALASNAFSHRFTSPENAERRLGLPVLATIIRKDEGPETSW